jgi:hypothetical protein
MTRLLVLILAQAYLTEVLLHSSLLETPRSWLKRRHPKLKELLECRICLGFWTALLLTQHLLLALAVAAAGAVFGEKFLNCRACQQPNTLDGFVVNR